MDQSKFWEGRSVFVTGATGFLGGWVIKRLLELGAEPVALVRDSNPRSMLVREGYLSRISVVYGSLEDGPLIRRALAEYSVETVFHLAAQPLVGVAKLDPVGTLQINVAGTWNVLEAARQTRVQQVVVASSDKAYGAGDGLPYREEHALRGAYPYDVSKSCTDLLSHMYATTYDLPVAVARCANLFGGGDLNFSRTIPGVIKATLEEERFVIRSDGKFIRDFLFIKDAAECYLLLAETLARGARPGAVNFSLEVKLTVLDVVQQALKVMGRTDLEPIIKNQASSEIREQYMACDKARQTLGWQPRYDFPAGLAETIAWYTSYFADLSREKLVSA